MRYDDFSIAIFVFDKANGVADHASCKLGKGISISNQLSYHKDEAWETYYLKEAASYLLCFVNTYQI